MYVLPYNRLLRSGADLYLTARDMQKGQKVKRTKGKNMLASCGDNHGKVELLHLELDSLRLTAVSQGLC